MGKLLILLSFLVLIINVSSREAFAVASVPCPAPAQTVPTEIGDLCTDPMVLIEQGILILTGIAGGVSLLLFFVGAGKYVLSMGNPEGVEDARGIITHAVTGLLLVVLTVFIIRLIGIDILALPGLTKSGTGVSTP